MTTWYVNSATGSNGYNGTSLATPFATIQYAHNQTAPGDTVYILPGNGYGGGASGTPVLTLTTSGTAGNTITYSGYPGMARPVINGTQAAGVISGVDPCSYITINYLELAGWLQSLTWANACISAGSGTALTNNTYIGGGTFFGGQIGGTTSTTIHHITISNCLIHDFPGGGTGASFCDYMTICNNIIYNCAWYSPFATSGISLYEQHNIDAGTGTKCVISGNIVYNCYNLIPEHSNLAGTTTTNSYNATNLTQINNVVSTSFVNYGMSILDCTAGTIPPLATVEYFGSGYFGMVYSFPTGNVSTYTTGAMASSTTLQFGYITDGEGIIIDNNQNTQSDSVAYVGRTLVSNNLIFGCGSFGISTASSNNCDVIFNTCYYNQWNQPASIGSGNGSEINNSSTNGSNFYNNICVPLSYINAGYDQSSGTTTWANNCFYGGSASHANPGTNNVTTSPLFIAASTSYASANFALQSTSPAIGVASASYTRTQSGSSTLPGSWGLFKATACMGAYEFHSSPMLVVSA